MSKSEVIVILLGVLAGILVVALASCVPPESMLQQSVGALESGCEVIDIPYSLVRCYDAEKNVACYLFNADISCVR